MRGAPRPIPKPKNRHGNNNPKSESIGTWKGKPIESLSREDLLKVVKHLSKDNEFLREREY